MAAEGILAIDQGTSSSRAVVYSGAERTAGAAQQAFSSSCPRPGWVEHDPEVLWQSCIDVARQALAASGLPPVAALGITNQRETTLLWRRDNGECLYPAIVWQDRRTAARCRELRREGLEDIVAARTGLRIDPYFSATKLLWMLDNVSGARRLADQGKLAFGTVDSFLVWRLTKGRVHATDATNASRTMLFDIHRQCWDEDLLRALGIPAGLFPR